MHGCMRHHDIFEGFFRVSKAVHILPGRWLQFGGALERFLKGEKRTQDYYSTHLKQQPLLGVHK